MHDTRMIHAACIMRGSNFHWYTIGVSVALNDVFLRCYDILTTVLDILEFL